MKRITKNTMEKKNIFAPLASGLGATRRAAMLLLVMMLTTATAWAQGQVASGSCGDHLTWLLTQHEYDDFYTLTISGEGDMYDYGDPSVCPWNSYAEQIQEVVIENGVTSIGDNAFNGCTNLESVTVFAPSCALGDGAFIECNLAQIYVFSDFVDDYQEAENWSDYAEIIKEMTNLNSKCGDDLTWELTQHQHEYDTFYTLTISGTGAIWDYGGYMNPAPWNSYAEQIYEVVIENGVTSIGDNAFDGCSGLTSVTIPASVTSIGNYAFNGTALTSIEIPASVTSIGEDVFLCCDELESVTFAEGSQLRSIGNWAFQQCSNLTSITIPASVTSIGSYVFQGCDNLASMAVADGNTVYDSRNSCNAIIEKSTNKLIIGCKNSTIPAGVTSIGAWAFYTTRLTSIEIPASVTSIGVGAFRNCPSLATVTVYAPSCSLGEDAFAYCNKLANIYVFSDLVDDYQGAENWSAYAEEITALPTVTTSYVDATGTLHEGVEAIPLNNAMTTLPAGTYVVNSDVAYTGTVTLSGDVTLILADGCTMSFGTEDEELLATIMECQNNNLTIYGQSGGTGWLKAYIASDVGINTVHDYQQYSGNVLIFDVDGACINADNSVTLLGGTLDVFSGDGDQGEIFALRGDINILGGKLWARENGLKTMNGKIILGYTKPTDEIYAYSYQTQDGLQIADGQTLVDEDGYIWSGTLFMENEINDRTLKPLVYSGVTLTGNGYNASATFDGTSETTVSIPVNVNVTSVTYNRAFTDGRPSTVMLPFSLGEGQTLTGGTLYKFTGVTKNETAGKWEATMTETATLQANTPYLLMPNNELVDGKVTFNLNWGTVTLNTTGGGNGETADPGSHWTFKGTYEYMKWTTETGDQDYNAERAEEIGRAYGFAGVAKDGINVGDFVRVASGAKIRPMSCYLLWSDMPNAANARALTRGAAATDEELPQSITVRLVGSNGETNAIGTLDTKTGEMTFDSEAWYTLDGVRLSGKPSKKGLYINNGRKIVIK